MSSSLSVSKHSYSLLKLYSQPNNNKTYHQSPAQLKKLHCLILKTLHFHDTCLFNGLITSYSNSGLLSYARRLFDQIPLPNIYSYNAILSAYSKSGHLSRMHQVFDSMPLKDGVSWNSLISAYARLNSPDSATRSYRLMLEEGRVSPNRITFSTLLKLSPSPRLGRQIHCQIVKYGFESYSFVCSPLLDMYTASGLIEDAKTLFHWVGDKNLVVYNTMLSGLFRCGMVDDSKRLFHEMACESNSNSISWTTMVSGLAQNGREREALDFFRGMRSAGVTIDQFTFGSALTACGRLTTLKEGRQIHAFVVRTCYDNNVFVSSALVDMYSKCAAIVPAESVFRRMAVKNVVSWTAIIVGYGQNGCCEEAVRVFAEMERSGVEADDFTLGSVIKSCARLASLEEGLQFHCRAIVSGLVSYVSVSNAIVNLYGKCGSVEDSQKHFDEMDIRDQVSWTSLVSGYAQFGWANETVELFETMLAKGVEPDGVTFIEVLSACSRAGLVEKGHGYFRSMVDIHRIVPEADHYACMIDLYSRAGRLEEAKNFLMEMPFPPDAICWAALLSSCRLHGNMEIGKWAAESLLESDPQNPASYVLLSSIYAARGRWDEVAKLRKGMRERGLKKEPGCSWIRYRNKVHIFSADDQSHPESEMIYAELERLSGKMEEEGYKPDLSSVLHGVTESEKRLMLSHHSEKLAIAFGLLFIPEGIPIRVVKNLRVCGDCHTATKLISKIVGREIIVRDAARFHKFSEGTCSCGDFW